MIEKRFKPLPDVTYIPATQDGSALQVGLLCEVSMNNGVERATITRFEWDEEYQEYVAWFSNGRYNHQPFVYPAIFYPQ